MRKPVSIQLYTVRDACAKDFPGTLREIAKIGYKGVELAGLHGMQASEVAALIKDLGMKVSSSHTALPTRENVQQAVDDAKTFGYDIIIAGLGPDDFKTMDDCMLAAAQFQEASQLIKGHGMQMAYHNHWWEFHNVDGRVVFDVLMEEAPALMSELDIYWVAYGKSDPADVVRRYRSRIPVLHVKDGNLEEGKGHTAVGSGKLDVPTIINAADPGVLQWLVVELDACETDMMQAVRDSYRYLTTSGLGEGNV